MTYIKEAMSENSKILIVGAGITGTALAALLERVGFVADIVEKMGHWNKSGFGITIMPGGMEVLRDLELVMQVRSKGTSANNLRLVDPDGQLVRQIPLKAGDVDSVTLDRGDLHKMLISKLSKTRIRRGISVAEINRHNKGASVTFTDGTTGHYDLVVGADGVRSATRTLIFPDIQPAYSGAAIWTFFLPEGVELESRTNVMQVWDDNEFMGIFPIKDHAAVTFSAPLDSTVDLSKFDLEKHFADIHVLAHDILRKVKNDEMYAGFLNELKLGQWYSGRVMLAGDAAHAMMPATGMGATMGLQDARAISRLIQKTPYAEWDAIPAKYQEQRKQIVDRVQLEAYLIGQMMLLDSPLKDLRDMTMKLIPQFVISHELRQT
jgi:2-polyprenyl-6-methoxyphenol hydroxylase-like FAD-dependent oxidoreductase